MPFGRKVLGRFSGPTPPPDPQGAVASPAPPPAPPAANPFGGPTINTSITPTAVYSPEQTQYAVNQARADLSQQGSLRTLMHQYDRPGVSRSPAVLRHVIPQVGDIRAQSAYASQAIPFQDAYQNAQSMLAGQTARSNEWLGLATQANQLQQMGLNANYSRFNDLLSLLLGSLGQFG